MWHEVENLTHIPWTPGSTLLGRLRRAVLATFVLTGALAACGEGERGPLENQLPAAFAGEDRIVMELSGVNLQGSGADPEGLIAGFQWTQLSGPSIALSGAGTERLSFTAPEVGTDGAELEFQLRVMDQSGAAGVDRVRVTVRDAGMSNPAPEALAGIDRAVDEGVVVLLDGSDSRAASGTIVQHAWRQLSGPAVQLSGAETTQARFTAPAVAENAELRFALTVADDSGGTDTDELLIKVADTTVVSIAPRPVLEGNTGSSPVSFPVTLSSAQPKAVTVSFATAEGTATSGLDYKDQAGELTFASGETEKQVTIEVLGDLLNEADETFQIALSGIRGARAGSITATGIISDASCATGVSGWNTYPHLIGSLHEHSGYSDGEVGTSPADYFGAGKALGLDYMSSSEHSDNSDAPVTANGDCVSPDLPDCTRPVPSPENPDAAVTKWEHTQTLAQAASTSSFTAFRGFEWTSDRFGHINVFLSANDLNAKADGGYAASMEPFWTWFLTPPEAGGGADGLMVFNHPGREDTLHAQFPDAAYTYNDFEYRPEADPRVVGIETFGKSDHAYDTDNNAPPGGWYAYALDKGWHLGPVGAEDEHGREWAQPRRAKTVLIVRDRSRPALREALQARRFYSLAQHHNDLRLTFTADGAPMGARLTRATGTPVLLSGELTAGAHDGILEIVTRGGQVVAQTTARKLVHTATVQAGEHWFYLRVKNTQGRPVAYSAPVWVRDSLYAVCPALNAVGSGANALQAVVAHRGASGHAPEHTLAAYDLGLAMGSDYIEQDIAMTLDGVLVCLHDDSLDRTARGDPANCSGPVAAKTLAQLKTCDMGAWFNEENPDRAQPEFIGQKIPALEEVFQRYGTTANYYIETKTLGSPRPMEQELLRLINAYGLRESAVQRRQVLVQSFTPESLQRMRTLDAGIPLIQLLFGGTSSTAIQAAAEYSFGIGPPAGEMTQAIVDEAHGLGLAVHPYTVNSSTDLERIGKLCVDGLFTNFPDRYRALVSTGAFDRCAGAIR